MADTNGFGQQIQGSIDNTLSNLGVLQSQKQGTTNVADQNMLSLFNSLDIASSDLFPKSIMLRGLDFTNILPNYWNQVFPYQFVILKAMPTGQYSVYSQLRITIPIALQDLQISSPFAIDLSVTGRSVTEEHNGLNIQPISFTATTGVMITRPQYSYANRATGNIGAIFGGTISSIQNLGSSIASVFPKNQASQPDFANDVLSFNGYYQYHALRVFLQYYTELKKTPGGRSYRLGLDMGKDRVMYLVTPQNFIVKKNAASPMEITYTFQGTAWASVNQSELLSSAAATTQALVGNSISKLQQILNGINNSRAVFQNAIAVIQAVNIDFQSNILGPLNNIILAIKTAASIPHVVADFGEQLTLSLQGSIVNQARNLSFVIPASVNDQFQKSLLASLPESSSSPSNQGVQVLKPSIFLSIDITSAIPLSALSITPQQQQAVDDAVNTAASTTNSQVNTFIDSLELLTASLEAQALEQGPDSPAWDIMNSAKDTISNMYSLLSDNFFGANTVNETAGGADPLFDFYQGYTSDGGVNFTKPQGKFAIPFPFRTTLEWLAQRYLGDSTLWFEIAALNNLQAPYIDEDGFTLPFLSNGNGNQFNISSSVNLTINQSIWIYSNTQVLQKRTIKVIQEVTSTNYIITVSGDSTLGNFTIADNAQMKSYLPNTVNSQKLIYLPIDQPSDMSSVNNTSIAFIDESPEMLNMSKVDWLLDSSGDLAVSNDGYQNLAYGKNNIIQAARLKLETVAGSLILHPEYGAGIEIGASEADVLASNLIKAIKESFLSDPRFASVDSINITQTPGVVKISITVTVANSQGIVPIDFELPI